MSYAEQKGLSVKAEVGDIATYSIEPNTYSLIILSNVLTFFNDNDIENIIKEVKQELKDNGLVYINAFDKNDPAIKEA